MRRKLFVVILCVSLAVFLLVICSCGKKSETTTEKKETEQTTEKETTKETGAKALNIGETASVEGGQVSVSKVTVTNNLTSSEANALLLTGEPGESNNVSKAPASGNEFLLITFKYKNTGTSASAGVRPVDIKLTNAAGKMYELVVTDSFGGIFNAKPIEAGKEGTITAVYEVPTGETGLVLTYQPFGAEAIQFKIR